eukprot:m.338900 g.338900  ORF g.338900 m.338900 type:complete len:293 (-) comp18587_c0_seq1:281-1159(-)
MRAGRARITFVSLALLIFAGGECKQFNKSIVFEKLLKVGGSTFGGVVRRIGRKYNLSGVYDGWPRQGHRHNRTPPAEPFVYANHGDLPEVKGEQFKILLVRTPDERQISYFYHMRVTRFNYSDDEDSMLEGVMRHNYRQCALKQPTREKLKEKYDFIAITERFDESVLLLKFLLPGLTLRDLLYIKAKDSSKVYTSHQKNFASLPPKVRQFFASEKFKFASKCQWEIWRIANQMIDERISKIDNFSLELLHFRRMVQKAERECFSQESLKDCFWQDNGCGVRCLDNLDLTSY